MVKFLLYLMNWNFIGKVLVLLLLPCMASAQYSDHRNRYMDSLEQVLTAHPPTGEELGNIYRELMWNYQQINGAKSLEYARKCVGACIPIDEWYNVSQSYRLLGMHHWAVSQYDSAMVYFDKALEGVGLMRNFPKKYNEKRIDDELSLVYGSIGNLYNILGKCPEAIDYYTRALKLFEKYDWKKSQSTAYENIGAMYLSMGNYPQAEINLTKLDLLAHATGDSSKIAHAKYQLGHLNLQTQEYAKALQNAEKAYAYFVLYPEEDIWTAITLNLLSEIYLEGYNDEAQTEKYVRKALQILDTLAIPREKAISLRIISTLHQCHGEWRKAEQTALEALATDDSEPANTLALYEILVKAFAKLGDANQSLFFFNKHNELQSSWVTKNYQSAIREMEVKYETEKKEIQIVSLETENRLLAVEKRLLAGLGIALLLGLLFLWRWTMQKRRFAEQQIKQLEQEKQLVATQALLDGETTERTRLSRDLHDRLGGMLSVLRLNLNDVKNKASLGGHDVVRFDHAIDLLDGSIDEMRRVAHHLMPDALNRFGLKTSLLDFLNTVPSVEFNCFGSDRRMDRKLELAVYLIIHELVNNALKHASATHILVQMVQETDRLALTVEDNGCGFDIQTTACGTGIRNMRIRVASFGGTIDMRSSPENGTETNVQFQL